MTPATQCADKLNPWLSIPLEDYEGHMNAVRQLSALAELFGQALEICRPSSLALLGVAGGNGLERVDRRLTRRVEAIDFNPAYVAAVRARFAALPGLTVHCLDFAVQEIRIEPCALVHAALVFEHAGLERALDNALALKARGGFLSVVLQLPSKSSAAVSDTPFKSIKSLSNHFHYIDVDDFQRRAGLPVHVQTRLELPGGKAFWMGIFARG